MLIYSIVPYEQIFPPEVKMETETKAIDGGFVELVKNGDEKRVARLISTDLRLYLKGPAPGDLYRP